MRKIVKILFVFIIVLCCNTVAAFAQNNNNLKQYEGTYLFPEDKDMNAGKIIFKAKNGKLIGQGEQKYKQSGGLTMKYKMIIQKVMSNGDFKSEFEVIPYDTSGSIVENLQAFDDVNGKFTKDSITWKSRYYETPFLLKKLK